MNLQGLHEFIMFKLILNHLPLNYQNNTRLNAFKINYYNLQKSSLNPTPDAI